jgi:hypothetical protein
VDTAPHPLLSEDQLRIAHFGPSTSRFAHESAIEEESNVDSVMIEDEETTDNVKRTTDHFGSLAISRTGESQFFGRAAYSLVCVMNFYPLIC